MVQVVMAREGREGPAAAGAEVTPLALAQRGRATPEAPAPQVFTLRGEEGVSTASGAVAPMMALERTQARVGTIASGAAEAGVNLILFQALLRFTGPAAAAAHFTTKTYLSQRGRQVAAEPMRAMRAEPPTTRGPRMVVPMGWITEAAAAAAVYIGETSQALQSVQQTAAMAAQESSSSAI